MNELEYMKITNGIDERFVAEYEMNRTDTKIKARRISRKVIIPVFAAAVIAVTSITGAVFAGAESKRESEIISEYSLRMASRLKPVGKSDTDKGIRMKVISADINEETEELEVFLSLKNVRGNKISEMTYDLGMIVDSDYMGSSCHEELLEYDEENGTAYFLYTESIDNINMLRSNKIPLVLYDLVCGQKHMAEELEIDVDKLGTDLESEPFKNEANNAGLPGMYEDVDRETPLLCNFSEPIFSEGSVQITAMGYAEDRKFHVKARCDEENGDCGSVELLDENGDPTVDYIDYDTISYTSCSDGSSYDETIFDITPEELAGCKLGIWYHYGGERVSGKWSVKIDLRE